MITDDNLRQIMPNLPQQKRADYLPFLTQAMEEFGINTSLRRRHSSAVAPILPGRSWKHLVPTQAQNVTKFALPAYAPATVRFKGASDQ